MDGMVFNDEHASIDLKDGYILEIKTTSNYASWADGVPDYYRVQVELYNHFLPTPKDKAYVAVCLVDDDTRKDPSSWEGSDKNVFLFEMPIDDAKVHDMLDKAIEWYKEFVVGGKTPDFDPTNTGDLDMWNHLLNITSDDPQVQADIDRLEELEQELGEKEAALKELQDERELLRNRIKDFMVTNKRNNMGTTSGRFEATITESKRTSIDKKLLEKDGIDPAKYTVTKVIQTFSLKPVKEENQEGE